MTGYWADEQASNKRFETTGRIVRILSVRGAQIAALCLAAIMTLAACARIEPPENSGLKLYDPEKTATGSTSDIRSRLTFPDSQCPPPGTAAFLAASILKQREKPLRLMEITYSIGDRFNLFIPNTPEFSGDYVINGDGRALLPFSIKVMALGLTNDQLTRHIEAALVRSRMFRGDDFRVSVRPVQYAAINITVGGAVFLPGRVTIGGVKDSDKGERSLSKAGDAPLDRDVAAALRSGGGVRPDADLSRVILKRGRQTYALDWQGAFSARPVDNLQLIDGDHIEVHEASCFQSALVRPSQITPPGIRIFQSNLAQPVNSNANSAIGQQSQNIPYGTRFLAGLVSSNCVGGSLATNARRHGVLISRNPKTLKTEVIQRSIEELVRSADRDQINPYLMPDDAIACYDSGMTDMKELATWVQTLLLPAQTVHGLRN